MRIDARTELVVAADIAERLGVSPVLLKSVLAKLQTFDPPGVMATSLKECLALQLAALPPEKSAALLKFATTGDFLTPTCPRCSVKMESRKSTKGGRAFWGCRNYPQCKQTIFASAP